LLGKKAIEKKAAVDTAKSRASQLGFRNGSRGLALNDYLCGHGASCETWDELLDIARTWNENLGRLGLLALPEERVIKAVGEVWNGVESGRITNWHRTDAKAILSSDEILHLHSDAFRLLALLRTQHTARCRSGGTFAISPLAMEEQKVLPGMSRRQFERARDALIQANKIRQVTARQ
jgi:hypothetical protein